MILEEVRVINYKNIPEELKILKRWIGYKLLPSKDRKPEKKPINLINGSWEWGNDKLKVTFNKAVGSYKRFRCHGLGFALEPPYIGIDVDHSLDLSLAKDFNSYTEYSPSRKGYHVIVKGEIPRAKKTDKFEVYQKGRWFTFTGNKVAGFPSEIVEANKENLGNLFEGDKRESVRGLDELREGNRNNNFTKLAGSLRSKGYSEAEIYNLLVAQARECNFSLYELKTICHSISKYEPKIKVDDSQASNIEEFLEDQEVVEWIVPGMIAKKSIGFVAGLPEVNKTWMLIDLAIECARGK